MKAMEHEVATPVVHCVWRHTPSSALQTADRLHPKGAAAEPYFMPLPCC